MAFPANGPTPDTRCQDFSADKNLEMSILAPKKDSAGREKTGTPCWVGERNGLVDLTAPTKNLPSIGE